MNNKTLRGVVERAWQEAERRYPPNRLVDDPLGETGVAESDPYGYDEVEARGFEDGAIFAATVTAEQVEAGARDLYYEEANDSDGFDAWPEWESHDNPTRDIWRLRVESMVRAMGFRVGADA